MLVGQENPCGPLALEIWYVRPSVGFPSFRWSLSGSKPHSLSLSPSWTSRTTVMAQSLGSMKNNYTDHLRFLLFTNLMFSSLKVRNFLYFYFLFACLFCLQEYSALPQQSKKNLKGKIWLLTHRNNEGIHSNYCTHPSTLRMAIYFKSSQILKMRFHVSLLLFY